jgi:hypothetical protein
VAGLWTVVVIVVIHVQSLESSIYQDVPITETVFSTARLFHTDISRMEYGEAISASYPSPPHIEKT